MNQSDLKLKKIISKAKKYAEKRGFGENSEDFSQEAAIYYFTHGQINFEWVFTDFLRREYGSTRTLSGSAKSTGRRFSLSLDKPSGDDDETLLHERIACTRGNPEPERQDWRNRVYLTGVKSDIADSIFSDDLDIEELSIIYSVGPSRISQHKKQVEQEIQKIMIIDEAYDFYKDDTEYSKLAIDWIKI